MTPKRKPSEWIMDRARLIHKKARATNKVCSEERAWIIAIFDYLDEHEKT